MENSTVELYGSSFNLTLMELTESKKFSAILPMVSRTLIRCKGTIPGTSEACEAELCQTDGSRFYFRSGNLDLILELDPPVIECNVCGYKTKLRYTSANESSRTDRISPKRRSGFRGRGRNGL